MKINKSNNNSNREHIKNFNNILYRDFNFESNRKHNKNKRINNYNNIQRNKIPKRSNIPISSDNSKRKYIGNQSSFTSKLNNQQTIIRVEKIMEYTSEEKNLLPYDLALENDNRTYCQYYISLLKTKHNFIFSFFQNDDYNSRIIKIDLFFINFAVNYTVNGLFFDDDSMHKIYVTKGSFNLEYQLPKIIYSSLISIILNKILRLLAISNDSIIDLKKDKSINGVDERKNDLERNLKIKFFFYFLLGLIFLVAFWYYIAMFGVIYKNTQIHLLSDTLISFGLSNVYPFAIYLLPGLCRIPALSNKKNKNKLNLDKRTEDLNNKISIKFFLYFIIGIIFNLFFWYYLSIFCAVYRNTQYHLIKDTLISFGFSLIYPFGIYLLPGFFRIPALSNLKNKRIYLYNLSKIIQIF